MSTKDDGTLSTVAGDEIVIGPMRTATRTLADRSKPLEFVVTGGSDELGIACRRCGREFAFAIPDGLKVGDLFTLPEFCERCLCPG